MQGLFGSRSSQPKHRSLDEIVASLRVLPKPRPNGLMPGYYHD